MERKKGLYTVAKKGVGGNGDTAEVTIRANSREESGSYVVSEKGKQQIVTAVRAFGTTPAKAKD